MNKGLLAVIGVIIVLLVVLGAGFSWITGIQKAMVREQQNVLSQEGRYGAALETLSEKIKGIWSLEKDFLDHEKETLTGVIKARAEAVNAAGRAYSEATAQGNPDKTIEAANEFNRTARDFVLSVNVNALREAYPQLFSPGIVQQTLRGLEEAVNEIRTSLDDWQVAIRDYNTYRAQWPQRFVGDLLRFPASFDYYKAEKAKLNMDELMPEK